MSGAKLATMLAHRADDGGKRNGSPRRARISRKTTAQGRPGCLRLYLWFTRSRKFSLRGGPGCSGHPAFTAPSALEEGELDEKLGRKCAARTWAHVLHPSL